MRRAKRSRSCLSLGAASGASDRAPMTALTRGKQRLQHLTKEQLLDLAVEQASATQEGRRICDAHLAEHTPVPQWALAGVLLSPDLLPHVMRTLGAEDLAAMRVCRDWHACWRSTLVPRRILHLAEPPIVLPECLDALCAMDGERMLVSVQTPDVLRDHEPRLWRGQGQHFEAVPAVEDKVYFSTMGNSSLYTLGPSGIRRYSLESFELLAKQEEVDIGAICVANGLLFSSAASRMGLPIDPDDEVQDEDTYLTAFDADSLEYRFGFGSRDHFTGRSDAGAAGLAVHGDELFACDKEGHRLQVFSFTGQHRRTIQGDFRRPESICFDQDRLYLIEDLCEPDKHDDAVTAADKQRAGRCIKVLSPEGKTLQVLCIPPGHLLRAMALFQETLVATLFPETYGDVRKPKKPRGASCKLVRLAGV